MDLHLAHIDWPRTAGEAVAVQRELAARVETADRLGAVRLVAGVDVGYDTAAERSYAAVAVLRFPGLDLAEWAWAELPTDFPYIPGLLSFREIPVILAAMERLTLAPDLVLVDGQGIAHPRRIGIASHLGVLLDLPTIGAAKSRLVGRYDEPGPERGDRSPLVHRGEVVGAVLRTRSRVGPLFVSAGHRVSLDTAVGYTLACAPKYRLPETTRQAHNLAARAKAEARQSQFPLPGLPEKG